MGLMEKGIPVPGRAYLSPNGGFVLLLQFKDIDMLINAI
jgi:hypothetical protein